MSRTIKDTPSYKDRFQTSEAISRQYIRLGFDVDTSLTYEVV